MNTSPIDVDQVPTAPFRPLPTSGDEDVWLLRRELLLVRAFTQTAAPSPELLRSLADLEARCPTVDSQIRRLQLAAARLRLSRTLAVVSPVADDDTVPDHPGLDTAVGPELLAAEATLTRCAVAATRSRAYLNGYLAIAAHLLGVGDRGVALTVIDKAVECVEHLREAVLEATAVATKCQLQLAA